MSILNPDFALALQRYVDNVQCAANLYYERDFPSLPKPAFAVEPGKRFVRVFEYGSQRKVHSFVDSSNGDVLKPESWKKPARHARGNIYSEQQGLEALANYSYHVRYL